jgi:glutamine---fructose-6-phosphate transaminase (isomerizing)
MQLGRHMEAEIRQQPDVLSQNADRYLTELRNHLQSASFDLVLLAARGSSDHAALYARYLIEVHLGIPVSLAAPSVLTRFGREVNYPKCLAIGISQSGAAPDVSEVLRSLRSHGHTTLAITNTAGSRLTEEAEHSLLLEAGGEQSIAATKTYTTSLLAVYQLVRTLGATLPAPALPDDNWVQTTLEAALEAQGAVVRNQVLFSLARGYSYASAHETALKLMECALIPCKAYSTADFEHGPKALAGVGTTAVVYGQAPNLTEQGCDVVVAPDPGVSPELRPIWEIFFGQWLSLCAARARGLDPDGARNLNKVTRTL